MISPTQADLGWTADDDAQVSPRERQFPDQCLKHQSRLNKGDNFEKCGGCAEQKEARDLERKRRQKYETALERYGKSYVEYAERQQCDCDDRGYDVGGRPCHHLNLTDEQREQARSAGMERARFKAEEVSGTVAA